MKKTYISGPMTGHEQFNYPEFNRVAQQLRELGYEVANPAENEAPPCGTWKGYMRIAIGQLVTCDEIRMLRGWAKSEGAQLEHLVAQRLGLVITGAPA